jgi:hypothetical protein
MNEQEQALLERLSLKSETWLFRYMLLEAVLNTLGYHTDKIRNAELDVLQNAARSPMCQHIITNFQMLGESV